MKLNQLVAGAAIGCALGAVGIGLGSGTANAAPQCPPGVQCDPGGPGGPGGPRPDPAIGVLGGPPQDDQVVPAIKAVPAVRPATSADPVDPAVPAVHRRLPRTRRTARRPHRPATSAARTITIGGHRGIPRTTTGADDSTAPRGVTDCRRGAGAHRRRRYGTGRCLRRGARRHRRSTTSATTSNRCGIPATTSGVSGSSGSGFRYRSDKQSGETAASDNPGAVVNASAERVADRQVLEAADERGRDVLRVARPVRRTRVAAAARRRSCSPPSGPAPRRGRSAHRSRRRCACWDLA